MILTDAGPLVALIDRDDPDHADCVNVLSSLRYPMLTTWPAFTEAVYLLGRYGGWRGQQKLWALLRRGDLELLQLESAGIQRTCDLMEQYSDRPMDLADATLVVAAEDRDLDQIFTLDADFLVYRIKGRKPFRVVP